MKLTATTRTAWGAFNYTKSELLETVLYNVMNYKEHLNTIKSFCFPLPSCITVSFSSFF